MNIIKIITQVNVIKMKIYKSICRKDFNIIFSTGDQIINIETKKSAEIYDDWFNLFRK